MNENGPPKGWAIAPLGDICVEKVEQREPGDGAVPYIDIGSIDRDTKAVRELEQVTRADAPTRARQSVRAGDVLVSMTRPNLNAVALVPRHLDGAIASTGFDVLRPLEVLSEWVFNRVRSHDFVADVSEGLQGVVYPAIRPHDVRKHECPIPPLPEQHRIVEAIESYFTRLDDTVATLKRVQQNLKRYRASVLKEAVEGRLVPTEAELARAEGRDYEIASVLLGRILAERRRRWHEAGGQGKYQEPVATDPTYLPELPTGWCWATVDQVLDNHDHARVPVKRADRARRQGEFAYYGASGVIDTIDEYLFDGSYLLLGEDGANLLARSKPIAFQAHGKFWVNNHAHVFQTYLDLPLAFMEVFFNAIDLAPYVTGTAQPKLPQAAMNKIPVPLPPATEQARIVEGVEQVLSVTHEAEHALTINQRRCARLRQSILKWAFEGRLADQDPSDEPASVLLARIKAERDAAEATRKNGRTKRGA